MFCAKFVRILFPAIFVFSTGLIDLTYSQQGAAANKQRDALSGCGLATQERIKIRQALTSFAELKQMPFRAVVVRVEQGNTEKLKFPQQELEAKRYKLLRPIIDILLKNPKCAVKVLGAFEKILLAERGGKALQRLIFLEQGTDNHNQLAHLILGTREILQARSSGIPALSLSNRFRLEGFYKQAGLAKPIFHSVEWVYASNENSFEKDRTKHRFFLIPQAIIDTVKKRKDGGLIIQIRFPKLARRAKVFAKKLSKKAVEDLEGSVFAEKALNAQWHDLQIRKIEIYEGLDEDGKTLATGAIKLDPSKGTLVTFLLSPKLVKLGNLNRDSHPQMQFNVRYAGRASYDGVIDKASNHGIIEFRK